MQIGVPKEVLDGELRVALVPEVVRKLSAGRPTEPVLSMSCSWSVVPARVR